VADDGWVSFYSTPGASNLVAAPSNGGASSIWTTDRVGAEGYSDGASQAPDNVDPDYTARFGGTSSAAPAVAGVVGLMLEANPDLGWRDVQEILAYTARHAGTAIGSGVSGFEFDPWRFNAATTWNGGGLHFSNDYGFGLVDALAAVRLAETWTRQQTSANLTARVGGSWSGDLAIPDDDRAWRTIRNEVDKAVDIERIGLRAAISGFTGDYRIEITSPGGTKSTLSTEFNEGTSATGDWVYVSNAFRGESSVGIWRVRVSDRWAEVEGDLTAADLFLLGSRPRRDDVFVFTNEFSDYADRARRTIADADGGMDTINASAVSAATRIDLKATAGKIDGVAVTIARGIENVVTGDGADRVAGDAAANRIEGGRGADVLNGRNGRDRLFGGQGDDAVKGRSGDDLVRGGAGRDVVYGGRGDDRVHGDGGADYVYGGSGADRLHDGAGFDHLFGRSGPDQFVLAFDGRSDRICDYQDGSDKIRLSGLDFAALSFAQVGRDVSIAYADEDVLVSAASGSLHVEQFGRSDFIFA
jgi:subtilisin-like proprotein convertase family protein